MWLGELARNQTSKVLRTKSGPKSLLTTLDNIRWGPINSLKQVNLIPAWWSNTPSTKDYIPIYPFKLPPPQGVFYFFNHTQTFTNALQYLAPRPTYSTDLVPLTPPK